MRRESALWRRHVLLWHGQQFVSASLGAMQTKSIE